MKAWVITSSPGFTPAANKDNEPAAVPDEHAIAYLHPSLLAKAFQKFLL